MARFCTLFSGSSGNCIYIGTGAGGILIDAGVSARRLNQALFDRGIDSRSIRAIFVTHEHSDHIAGLRVFASKFGAKVYASPGTMAALESMNILTGKFETQVIEEQGVEEAELLVSAFATSHDSAQSIGFRIHTPDGRKISVATDLGLMTDAVHDALSGSDLVVLESNHDIRMLENGGYPYYLKRRILSPRGHLSNDACTNELIALARSGTARFVLAHLSHENNMPQVARETARCGLSEAGFAEGKDYLITVAPRCNQERVLVF